MYITVNWWKQYTERWNTGYELSVYLHFALLYILLQKSLSLVLNDSNCIFILNYGAWYTMVTQNNPNSTGNHLRSETKEFFIVDNWGYFTSGAWNVMVKMLDLGQKICKRYARYASLQVFPWPNTSLSGFETVTSSHLANITGLFFQGGKNRVEPQISCIDFSG